MHKARAFFFVCAGVFLLALPLLSGCASYSAMFVNANGQVERCAATGGGGLGIAMAADAVNDCVKNMHAAGFLELERAGTIGVTLAEGEAGKHPRVLKVFPGSPAERVGIKPGDLFAKVDGQDVWHQSEASVLLFGEAETTVAVTVTAAGQDKTLIVRRIPYTTVYGTKPAAAPTLTR